MIFSFEVYDEEGEIVGVFDKEFESENAVRVYLAEQNLHPFLSVRCIFSSPKG